VNRSIRWANHSCEVWRYALLIAGRGNFPADARLQRFGFCNRARRSQPALGKPAAMVVAWCRGSEGKMKSWLVATAVVVAASPAWAQGLPKTGARAGRADACAPIGRTADGKMVYSLKCENLPAPPVAAAAPVAPAAEPEERGGLFRNPFPSLMGSSAPVERESGIGPSTGGR
jgi:hypothetical protein